MSAIAVPIPEVFVAKHGGTTEQARRMEAQMAEPAPRACRTAWTALP
ncbi:hypothetical protein ABZY05_04930 [Streptomyces canus]